METFRGIPISKIREYYMREGHRNEMFSSMIADVIESNPDFRFELERVQQPEQQEQRIWELDSDEEDPTEEEKEKKRAKNKKKYLRKREKQQAEKDKREEWKGKEKDGVEQGLAGLAIQDTVSTPIATAETRELSSGHGDTAAAVTGTPLEQPKLSKRQKKTLLKKAKQAQNKTSTPELVGSSTTSDSTSISNETKFGFVNHDDRKKRNKVDGGGHKESEHEDNEKEAATESEFEAVMDTVAKRFGQ
ncbi:uncharacterized protein M437DRAFT_62087 [Aureobasidium melanogenum CBS 110374]|uniref:Uncharacterized protein n=1 Tax=Aureobasidium melanogenum (strain CBS 110374) TaxID=1043003 RepID=A0A074WCT9_AURM1|nr:uncharacterized protein M437DRAFT_62087 [Aureobasidium melanogenum CBS 110374]KEQ67707.1 hypothetical protein M437DRAFT_62087 [Aureobasidium melanogenum CBS 110374]